MVNDVGLMRLAVAECLTGMGKSVLTLVVLVAVMFQQDWVLATGAFIVFPVASYFVARLGKRFRKVSANTQAELGHFSTILNQTLPGSPPRQGVRDGDVRGSAASAASSRTCISLSTRASGFPPCPAR